MHSVAQQLVLWMVVICDYFASLQQKYISLQQKFITASINQENHWFSVDFPEAKLWFQWNKFILVSTGNIITPWQNTR